MQTVLTSTQAVLASTKAWVGRPFAGMAPEQRKMLLLLVAG